MDLPQWAHKNTRHLTKAVISAMWQRLTNARPQPASIVTLPNEILLQIISELPQTGWRGRRTLAILRRTHRRFLRLIPMTNLPPFPAEPPSSWDLRMEALRPTRIIHCYSCRQFLWATAFEDRFRSRPNYRRFCLLCGLHTGSYRGGRSVMVNREVLTTCGRCDRLYRGPLTCWCCFHSSRWLYLVQTLVMFGTVAWIGFGGERGGGPPVSTSPASATVFPVNLPADTLFFIK